jgi:hypothetical protein
VVWATGAAADRDHVVPPVYQTRHEVRADVPGRPDNNDAAHSHPSLSTPDPPWEPNVSPWYRCTTTPAATLFTWGDYFTYVAQYYDNLAGANLSLDCVRGSTGSFGNLVKGCLALLWKDAPPIVRTLLDTAFDALKCIAAAKNPPELTIGACISASGAELVVLAIHAAFNAVPAGQAFLKTPFPVQP